MIKSNNLLNNALAMQEALQSRRRRSADAQSGRRARRVLAVELLHRPGRRRADAAARRRACCRASRASSSWNWPASSAFPRAKSALTPDDLRTADEAFITGTTREVTPVVRVDDPPIGSGTPGPITTRLLALFRGASRRLARQLTLTTRRLTTEPATRSLDRLSVAAVSCRCRVFLDRRAQRTSGCDRRTGCRCATPAARTCCARSDGTGIGRLLARVGDASTRRP